MKPRSHAWRTGSALAARAVVSMVFIVAALPKLADPAAFARDIANYRLMPGVMAGALAVYLPWLELVLGCALWVPNARPAARVLGFGLLAAFAFVLLSALVRGLDVACGCFGSGRGGTSLAWALTRDLGLIALLALDSAISDRPKQS
jgi:Methylamine utilisation protein MauE.